MKIRYFFLLSFGLCFLAGQKLHSQAKDRTWGVGIEISGGYADVANDGFKDLKTDRVGYAYGFLDQVTRGHVFSGKMIFYLPFGLNLFSGYEHGGFGERNASLLMWKRIYGQDFENNFLQESYSIQNHTRAIVAGLSFAPITFKQRFRPFGFGELRKQWLRSTTTLEGEAFNFWSIFGPETGSFNGSSLMSTNKPFSTALGVGIEVLLPWNFTFAPAWQIVSTGTKIIGRTTEYTITPHEENEGIGKTFGDLDILDGQGVKLKYHEFRLGIRYRIF